MATITDKITKGAGRPMPSALGHGTAMVRQAEWVADAVEVGATITAHQGWCWLKTNLGPKWHAGYGWALDKFRSRTGYDPAKAGAGVSS